MDTLLDLLEAAATGLEVELEQRLEAMSELAEGEDEFTAEID
jgi:hypothetical protein